MDYIQFTDLEGLKIATEMERRGREFYDHAAKIATNPGAVELLTLLAKDEEIHEEQFRTLAEKLASANLEMMYYEEEVSAYLSAVAADVVFPQGLMGLVKNHSYDSPQAVLEAGIQSEKDAILFYSEIVDHAQHERSAVAFREIVRQEKTHLSKLQRMLMAVAQGAEE